MKKLLIFIAMNLLIGNVVAWFMGSAPIEFAKIDYSPQEQQLVSELKAELEQSADDTTLQTQLGAIYSLHNYLDEAQSLLSAAVQAQQSPLALAWLSGTQAKQAGAMFDPFMGFLKLYRLHSACAQLDRAVSLAPDNFEVRMIRMASFAPTDLLNCSLETAFTDERWFKKYFAAQGASAPLELKLQFMLTMSIAYSNAGGTDNQKQAEQYVMQYKQLSKGNNQPPTVLYQLAVANKLLAENS
jgi:hypothetical protein